MVSRSLISGSDVLTLGTDVQILDHLVVSVCSYGVNARLNEEDLMDVYRIISWSFRREHFRSKNFDWVSVLL